MRISTPTHAAADATYWLAAALRRKIVLTTFFDVGPTLSGVTDRDALPSIDDCVLTENSPLTALQIQALEAFGDCAGDHGGA